ncbi:MAG: Phytanoyl-CoA dioxygenase (PhyH) [Ilumatobacteraceae bacterium]|nr:Phytanoyl-CoA dioxygenase (PhyH) [Ilumatobacteraceae bacterium]
MDAPTLLTTDQVASFVARGFVELEAVVPDVINARAMEQLPQLFRGWLDEFTGVAAGAGDAESSSSRLPRSGTTLHDAYPADSAFGALVRVPAVAGAIQSLVGTDPVVDHHFVHIKTAGDLHAQGLHCDAIVDEGLAFDIQLFWFPHDVAPGEGGTRFVPGSHLRRVNMDDVSRYQHLAGERYFSGPAGTVVIFHQGLWHAGAPNRGARDRVMGKLRLNPTQPQVRLWDTSDLDARNRNDDHMFARMEPESVAAALRRSEPWYEPATHRLETVQRARLWRHLSGDDGFDVDWYLTRTERRAALSTS